jgi:zinc protease
LNYGDYAYIEPYRERSLGSEAEQGVARRQAMFHMWIRPTSVENAPFALKLALTELEDLVRDGLTQQELDDVRAWLIGANALWFADPGSRLAAAAEAEAGGWEDMYRNLPSKLEALTLDEVNAALRRHLHPADLRIVAVGAADGWVERLVGAAPTPIVYQGVTPGAAQAARDADVSARSVGIAADAVRRVPAEQVFR